MQTDVLREFVKLSYNPNFSVTARELHLSQSALSNHIIALEAELGITLIDRKKSSLTDAGKVFLEGAIKTLADLDKAVADSRYAAEGGRQTLRIGIQSYIPAPRLVQSIKDAIREFKSERKYGDIEIVPILMENAPNAIRGGIIDCGYTPATRISGGNTTLTSMPSGFEDFDMVPVIDVQIGIYVSAANPLAKKKAIVPQDLDGVPIAIRVPGTSKAFCDAIDMFLSQYGIVPKYDYIVADSDDEMVMLKLHEETVYIIEPEVFNGVISFKDQRVWIPFDPPHYSRCHMAFSKSPRNQMIAEFEQFMKQRFQPR